MKILIIPAFIILGLVSCNSKPNSTTKELIDDKITAKTKTESIEVSPADENAPIITSQDYFLRKYKGTIDGQYPIEMILVNGGEGYLHGYYQYTKIGKRIDFNGELNLNEMVVLEEGVGNKKTGIFTFSLEDTEHIEGTWKTPNGQREMPFELTAYPVSSKWFGGWHLNEVWNEGTLIIGNVTQDSFEFTLDVFTNGHMGSLFAKAVIDENKAVYKKLSPYLKEDGEVCKITFELQEDHIVIDQKSSSMACDFGMRAYVSGQFDNRIINKKPNLEIGDDAFFKTQETHDIFKKLVAIKGYEKFAYNMQITNMEEQAAADIGAIRIMEGVVQGMFLTNEAIIITNKQNDFWAATLDFDGTHTYVRYFTTDKKYASKLPLAIGKWRERFKEYKVIYENE